MGADLNIAGINLAMRGLAAAQQALNTAGHDIANASTEGFSRQSVKLAATTAAYPVTPNADPRQSSLGTGVDVTGVIRQRDQFLDNQFRNINLQFGEHETVRDIIKQIEGLFNEPSDSGLNSLLGQFFDAWHELAADPTQAATRANLRESGIALAGAFNEIGSGLLKLRADLDGRIRTAVQDTNSSLAQLAELNGQIATALGANVTPNDLLDQRDLLLDKLSKFADIQTSQRSDGTTWVFVFGKAVVQGDRFKALEVNPTGELAFGAVAFDQEPIPPKDLGGVFKALFDLRDRIIGRPVVPGTSLLPDVPGGMSYQLDVLANRMAEAVNALHRNGTPLNGGGGTEFFTKDPGKGIAAQFNSEIITAANITVNPVFSAGGGTALDLIAAGGPAVGLPQVPPPRGDNATALKIAQLRQAYLTDGKIGTPVDKGQFTVQDFYRNILTSLGVQGQAAEKLLKNQRALLEHVENLRQSVSGVSLDEEMASMVKFQHAYAASARMLNTFDQMLDRVINSMGQVGR